jgi:hypothetical protein
MSNVVVKQRNVVSRELRLETLDRNACEETDLRIEGHGISLRLPFLPTLQRLLFQDEVATRFYEDRIRSFETAGVEATAFNSPAALFNFLVPSYHLSLREVYLIEESFGPEDEESKIMASEQAPGFGFSYRTSKFRINSQRVILDVMMNATQCYLKLWSSLDGEVLATSMVEAELGGSAAPDPIIF